MICRRTPDGREEYKGESGYHDTPDKALVFYFKEFAGIRLSPDEYLAKREPKTGKLTHY